MFMNTLTSPAPCQCEYSASTTYSSVGTERVAPVLLVNVSLNSGPLTWSARAVGVARIIKAPLARLKLISPKWCPPYHVNKFVEKGSTLLWETASVCTGADWPAVQSRDQLEWNWLAL